MAQVRRMLNNFKFCQPDAFTFSDMIEEVHLWKPLIWRFQYQFNCEALLPKIDSLRERIINPSNLEIGDAISTVGVNAKDRPHHWSELQHFNNFLKHKIAYVWDQYEFKTKTHSSIEQSWFNIHLNSGITLEHYHNNVLLIVVCYIQLPENSGYIQFRDPLEYHWGNTPIIPEEKTWKTLPCKTNDVLIFPGWIRHRVEESRSPEKRVVMTYNIV